VFALFDGWFAHALANFRDRESIRWFTNLEVSRIFALAISLPIC